MRLIGWRNRTIGPCGERGLCFGLRFIRAAGDFFRRRKTHQYFGRDVTGFGQLDETLLTFLECLVGVALLAETAARLFAALAQHGVDITPQQCADVYLHLFPVQVRITDDISIDRARLVFGKHDGGLRTHSGTSRAVGFAVVVVLDLDFLGTVDPIDTKEAEAETLHAIGAAVIIDDRKPGFPVSLPNRFQLCASGIDNAGQTGWVLAGQIVELHFSSVRSANIRRVLVREVAQHQERTTIVRRNVALLMHTGHRIAVFKQVAQRRKPGGWFQAFRTFTFIEDDAKCRLVAKGHGLVGQADVAFMLAGAFGSLGNVESAGAVASVPLSVGRFGWIDVARSAWMTSSAD
jgi:hypothetical protein